MPKWNTCRFLILLFLVASCATKHQPESFTPYFSDRPDSIWNTETIQEEKILETKENSSLLEKRRLLELYIAEQKQLKPSTGRYSFLLDAIARIKTEVAETDSALEKIQADLKKLPADKPLEKIPNPMRNSPLRKTYSEILQLWNHDDVPSALARIDDIEKNRFASLSTGEKLKFLNVKFRASLEFGNVALATKAYEQMVKADDCDPDTTRAGFLLSLVSFSMGDPKGAVKTFENQCDRDASTSNRIRRKYWMARFREGSGEDVKALYNEVAASTLPGYHAFLAQERLGVDTALPGKEGKTSNYLANEFPVPSDVDRALKAAELRLKSNLRKEASLYLTKAARILRNDADEDYLPAMLYTAHLFHASGNHLEAMKLYTDISNEFLDGELLASMVSMSLFSEMFPRPYQLIIDWVSRMWGVDPDFVYSIVRQESAFNPGAVSVADARGLMQIMPFLARYWSKAWNFSDFYTDKSLFSVEENLKLGIYHLSQLEKLLPHPALVAASYNAGINRVMNWWHRYGQYPLDIFVEFIPVNETRLYVKVVLRNYYYYHAIRNGGKVEPKLIPLNLAPFPRSVPDKFPTG